MRKEYRLLYLLAALKCLLPFLIQHPVYEPHRDEFLYLAEGRHLAWGFMEVPPLLSVFAWLTNLLGDGFFWIKCWPSLFGTFTFILVGRLVIALGGKSFALLFAVLPFIFGAYLRVFYLFQPNAPEILCWTAMAYGWIRYIQTGKPEGIYIAGIAAGIGMLSKYSVSFYCISLIAGLLLTSQRKALLNRHVMYAGLIAFIIFLPNLYWQYQHGFPVVYHMKELERTQLQYVSHTDFLKDQVLLNLPGISIWIAGLCWVSFSAAGRPYRFIGWATFFVLLILLAGHGKSYYALGAYPILFGFGSVVLERWATGKKYYFRYALVMLIIVLGYPYITIGLPFLPPQQLADYYSRTGIARKAGALRWEDLQDHPLPQDFADMLSWKEMATKTAAVYNRLDSNEKAQTLLFCDNYGEAGALSFYGPALGLPPAYSTNASFLYWLPTGFHFQHLLLVTDDTEEMQHAFIHQFSSAKLEDSISNPYAREYGTEIILLKNASEVFRSAMRDKINKEKLKTTARGTGQKIAPNPLEKGGNLH